MDKTFENFITDADSKAIVEELKDLTYDPGASFSPLILHGKSGVGKTHLCEAIRQEWENTVIYPAEEIKARIIKVLSNEITEEEFFALFSNHHVIMDDAQQFMFLTEVVDFGWNTVYFHWDAVQDLIAKFIINQRENGFYVILVFDDSFNKNRLNQTCGLFCHTGKFFMSLSLTVIREPGIAKKRFTGIISTSRTRKPEFL